MFRNKIKEIWRGASVGALLAVALGLALLQTDFGTQLIRLSYDIPFLLRPVVKPSEAVMVYMDDDSHRELNQPYDRAWDRGVHAQLVERLAADGAKAVVFDVLFTGANPEHPEGDERFARALKKNGRVILGAEYTLTADGNPTIIRAIDPFYDTAASALGFVQLIPDQDFIVRRHLHVPPHKEADAYSSMTWETANLLGVNATKNPKDRFTERWMNYYGPPGTIKSVSYHRAIATNEFCPVGFFSNKVVFVGANLKSEFSGKHKDEYRTPYTKGGEFGAAVDVQATQFLNLLHGDWLNRLSRPTEFILITLAGILFGVGLVLFRPLSATGVALFGAAIVTLIAHAFFWNQRLWFSWMIIVSVQIPVALFWSILFNSIQLYVQKKLVEQTLALYLSPKLVKKYSQQKFSGDSNLLKPGAEKQMLTILFSDIAGFTSISEGMDSDDLARLMNKYFETAVSQCVHKTDGTVVKYIGDAIFAFWNAPELQIDHQMRACEAAMRFQDQAVQYINNQALVTRIGLHTGVANVGNFGSTTRIDYTAIGENINLAARMEGLNKYLGTETLITGDTEAGVRDRVVTRYLGLFRLKGFEKSVEVYQLIGPLDKAEATQSLRKIFARALKSFQEKNFDAAKAEFNGVLKLQPNDGPTKFYLHQLEEMRAEFLPSTWKGEVELKDK